MENFKIDKTIFKAQTFEEAELDKRFPKEMSIGDRLREAWWLICMAYGIDYTSPPKMDKHFFSARKHSG